MTHEACPRGPDNPPEIEDLYPPGTTPERRFVTLSGLCSYGVTPLVMQGALRNVLIQHFGDVRNILNATLRDRMVRDGPWRETSDTPLVIESLHRWRPELAEKRPALVLKEGAWQWQQQGIGNQAGEDYRSGRQFFGGLWAGSHTIFAIAQNGAEAQILATEALKCLLWFATEIAGQLELQRFVPVSIGEVAALKESAEHYVVPVVVAYLVPEGWWIQPDAPRTKRIVWRTSTVLPNY